MRRFFSQFLAPLILTLTLTLTFSGAVKAQTWSLTYSGTTYNFSTVTNYSANSALLQQQAWWGNFTLASALATQMADRAGYLNYGEVQPYFAYGLNGSTSLNVQGYSYGSLISPSGGGIDKLAFGAGNVYDPNNSTFFVATVSGGSGGASQVPEIDGSKLPQAALLIAGAFLLWGRRKT